MGLFGKIISSVTPHEDPSKEISKTFPIAECSADECGNCEEKPFPSSLKIDTDTPLWGSAGKDWRLHIIVATGKTDWKHTHYEEEDIGGRVAAALVPHEHPLEKACGGRIKLNASSLIADESNLAQLDGSNSQSTSLLLLPYFIIIKNVTPENAPDLLLEAIQAYTSDTLPQLFASKPEFFQPSLNKGYILLCSHRTRDKRCGITAPIMRKKLEIELRHHDLYRDIGDDRPGGITVVFVSHVGGHKFNANLFLYLKSGESLWMARVQPQHAQSLVEKTVLEGKVFPELMRSCFRSKQASW